MRGLRPAYIRPPMTAPSASVPRDPVWWCLLIVAAFTALASWHLAIPHSIYFDEVHYTKAARVLLTLDRPVNAEHPMLGKELIGLGMILFGDNSFGWRFFSLVFGAIGLFAFSRALWLASLSRFAAIAGTLLVATDFAWFIQSRIAMLDMFMAAFAMIALWQLAAAVRTQRHARVHLALAGIALGLALGAKWSIAPAAVLPGLTFLIVRAKTSGRRFLIARDGAPVDGVSLIEAALWLGVVPALVYLATFAPGLFYAHDPLTVRGLIPLQHRMIELQDSVIKHHPYQSVWYQWLGDWRAIWYLYEVVDGARRGIVLIGNPLTMISGLPAVLWALWAGIWRGRRDALACAVLYLVCTGFWALSGKPVQFYYHYLLPGTFLMACLALALDELWRKSGRWRITPALILGGAAAMFVYFYPIISAQPLYHGRPSFERWMWLKSWR